MIRAAFERIRIMEASKFFKLRNVWHRIRRSLNLPAAPFEPFDVPTGHLIRPPQNGPYADWFARHAPRPIDLERMQLASRCFARQPLVSVVMATYKTPEHFLRATIESVTTQAYENWELCIADDGSKSSALANVLRRYRASDSRIKLHFRSRNGHISRATNSALELASGEFVVFLDHDDLLTPDALYEIVRVANERPDVDIIYSDEDKIDRNGYLCDPFFKPDWSPESFLSRMYVGHVVAIRRTLVEALGGMRPPFDGSQDYDLLLRATERTDRIHHIPRVLYHWRIHDGSTASDSVAKPYAQSAAVRALSEALARRGEGGRVREMPGCPGTYEVRFAIAHPERVSVIVPTRDHGDDVERCVVAALSRTSYPDLELIIIDNGSTDEASLATFAALAAQDPRVRVVRYDEPFNFSAITNYAASLATGTYLLFLNNDTEAISDGWIEAMVEHAQRPEIGAVGALLLYPDNSVQHAGVITGLGGVAGHSHKHYPGDAPGYYYMLKALNNYSAVTAACMMVRRSVFDRVGGFDESLAVAFNDVDFCLRVRDAGFRNLYVPQVVLYHFESKSRGLEVTPEKIERFAGEIARMKALWPSLALPDPYYNPNLTLDREDFSIAD